jgi:hypothetical protein
VCLKCTAMYYQGFGKMTTVTKANAIILPHPSDNLER